MNAIGFVHQPGGRNFDRPRSNHTKNFSRLSIRFVAAGSAFRVSCSILQVFVKVDLHKVFALNDTGDGDGSVRVGVIRDQTKGSKTKLGNSSVKLGKSVRTIGGASNDDHGANIAGFRLVA